jgi:hypothetical protein
MTLSGRLNELSAGIVDWVTFDIAGHRVEIGVHTEDVGKTAHYRLRFAGVSDIHFFDERVGDWNYVELTSISCSFLIDESVSTEVILWDERSRLVIKSATISLEDADLVDDSANASRIR